MNILLVDDEKNILFIYKSLLKKISSEHRFFFSNCGNQAIELLSSMQIDLILCDYRMNDGDGYDVYEWIIKNNYNAKFILITGFIDPNEFSKKHSLPLPKILLKPVDFINLIETINEYCGL